MMNDLYEFFEYDDQGDVLDVYFAEKRRAWTIELTDNILLSIDRQTEEPVSLTFLDYSQLVQPSELGARSFPLTGLAELPSAERALVIRTCTAPPVNRWLDISVVHSLPDSPFAVIHVQPFAAHALGLETA